MYKLLSNSYGTEALAVLRLEDMASIPFSEDNTDYQAYLKFLAEGGPPLPADAGAE